MGKIKISKGRKGLEALKPVYLIYGSQKLLLEEALERLKNRFSQKSDLNFDFEEFQAGQDDPSNMIQAASTLPLMGSKRLVVVKEAEKLEKEGESLLLDYIAEPLSSTCLVLVAAAVDKRSKLYKALAEGGSLYEYRAPQKRQYPRWVREQLAKEGKAISEQVAKYIVENVGYDLARLSSEIEKIFLNCQDKEKIRIEDVKEIITVSPEVTIFDLVDSLGRGDLDQALDLLAQLVRRKEPPLRIFHMIVRQFRLLSQTKVLLEKGSLPATLGRELGLPQFLVPKYREQSRNFSKEQLKTSFELLLSFDLSMKRRGEDPRLLLETLVVKLLSV